MSALLLQVLNYVRKMKHLKPLWFSNIANQIMWWTYVKAFWRGLVAAFGTKITFKTTLKGTGRCAFQAWTAQRLSQIRISALQLCGKVRCCWTRTVGHAIMCSWRCAGSRARHLVTFGCLSWCSLRWWSALVWVFTSW